MSTISARSVSAALRRAGWLPIASRMREGIRVTGGLHGRVAVTADWDSPVTAERRAVDVAMTLVELGYTAYLDGTHVTVGRAS